MGDEIDIHIGKRARRRRRLLGLTQEQVAGACGVRFQQIQKYECGANRISAARIWRLARALDVPVGYFFEGLDETAQMSGDGEDSPESTRAFYKLGRTPRRRVSDRADSAA
jgi:transcriptional regulator with XRE-family HTH domain